jgi:two-component system KDP operon response regulator KdpE
VSVAANGTEALKSAAAHPPDLVILDLGLPDMDGIDVIGGLRGWTAVPIIVLSGRADSTDKVAALDAGADDYVTKPFGMDELLARMRAAVRRTPAAEAPAKVTLGDLTVDLAAKRVTWGRGKSSRAPSSSAGSSFDAPPSNAPLSDRGAAGGASPQQDGDVRLTPTEWHLLEVLLRNPGKLLSHRQLLNDVWGPGYDNAGGNLRLYMAQLRRKLEPDPARPRWLITEPGMGYRYQPPDPEEQGGPAGPTEPGGRAAEE